MKLIQQYTLCLRELVYNKWLKQSIPLHIHSVGVISRRYQKIGREKVGTHPKGSKLIYKKYNRETYILLKWAPEGCPKPIENTRNSLKIINHGIRFISVIRLKDLLVVFYSHSMMISNLIKLLFDSDFFLFFFVNHQFVLNNQK